MGNNCKLSHVLIDLGFFSALGTSEHPGMTRAEIHVKRDTPNRWDENNGVLVVYDEEGRPWIKRSEDVTQTVDIQFRQYALKRGAYVPHSNDGGHFVRNVIPTL